MESSEEKKESSNALLIKAVAGVFVSVLAPVLVAFGVKLSETVVAPAANAPAANAPAANAPAAGPPANAATPTATAAPTPVADTKPSAEKSVASAPAPAPPPAPAASAAPSIPPGGLVASKVEPKYGAKTRLVNGRDLTGFHSYLGHGEKNGKAPGKNSSDPDKVFTVKKGGLHISGQTYGSLITDKQYSNYRLTVEYKWGDKTWPPREDKSRTSGIVVHGAGPEGAVQGAFMAGVRCNLSEGLTGSLGVHSSEQQKVTFSAESFRRDAHDGSRRHPRFFYRPGEPVTALSTGLMQRFPSDFTVQDNLGYRAPGEIEKPHGEWNSLEILCDGGTIRITLNGKVVMYATAVSPSKGHISFQSRGAEILFRSIELTPIVK